jgi:hypothetical protein
MMAFNLKGTFLLFAVLLFFTACGFVPANRLAENLRSISVSPICSDPQGRLRVALAQELLRSGSFYYSANHPDLFLCVEITDLCEENIGFRYDRDNEGVLTNSLIPTETRRKVTCRVVVEDRCGQKIMGPFCISEEVDFDHDFYQNYDAVNVFSLGQITDLEAAEDAALKPLYTRLAKKIVRYLGAMK